MASASPPRRGRHTAAALGPPSTLPTDLPSGQRRPPPRSHPAPLLPPVLTPSQSRERPPPAPPPAATAATSAVSCHHAAHGLRDTRAAPGAHGRARGFALCSTVNDAPTVQAPAHVRPSVALSCSVHNARPLLRAPSCAVCSAVCQAHVGPRTERGTAGNMIIGVVNLTLTGRSAYSLKS